jgi:surfeit locus 1 family protein
MADAPPRRERRGLLLSLALIGFIILCGLGTWQVQRLAWKQDLMARVEERTTLAPVSAPGPATWADIDYDDLDYLPVSVAGAFLNDQEVYTYVALSDPAGTYGGQGYFVLTPFVTDEGWVVLVNRGFVPEAAKDPAVRADAQIEGEIEISGLLRPPQGRNWFTPADDPEGGIWFTRDPETIASSLSLDGADLAPYYIDAFFDPDLPGGVPQGGETTVTFPNNHLQYAVTWFGLAAVLLVMTILRLRAGRKRDPET